MDIRNTSELKACAVRRLRDAGQEKRIAAIYAAVTLGLSVLVALVNLVLDSQIAGTTGLGGLGRRTTLSSLQTLLPWVVMLVTMCLDLGYQAAMLRVARGQYATPQTLRLGFDRFWVLLRCVVLEGLMVLGLAIAGVYLGTMIFMMTPFSDRAVELLAPVMQSMTLLNQDMTLDEGTYAQLMSAMVPAFILCLVIVGVLVAVVMFRFRMAHYVLIDKPGTGALAALRESRKMMRGNCVSLLKLDIGLWWYYLASFLATLVGYGDAILPMLGMHLPWSSEVSYYVFYAVYLAAQFAVIYYLRNRAETSYGIAYDAVRPREKSADGVVLGNIFQM